MSTVRATPIVMLLRPPEERDDSYPEGHWVHAGTNLAFPAKLLYRDENLDDEVLCELLSPGEQAGGKYGGDQEATFHKEALVLTRMLMHMGIVISEE